MTAKLFLREVRDAFVQTVCQRGDEWPIHTVEDESSASKICPPGGM